MTQYPLDSANRDIERFPIRDSDFVVGQTYTHAEYPDKYLVISADGRKHLLNTRSSVSSKVSDANGQFELFATAKPTLSIHELTKGKWYDCVEAGDGNFTVGKKYLSALDFSGYTGVVDNRGDLSGNRSVRFTTK